jgi:hypothetical protein
MNLTAMSRKDKKNSFLVYHDWLAHCEYLEPEEFVELWKGLFAWHRGEEVHFSNRVLRAAWVGILPAIQINAEKYEERCQRNQENGKKGGRPPKDSYNNDNPENPVGYFETDSNQKNPIIDNREQAIDNREQGTPNSQNPIGNWEVGIPNTEMAMVNLKHSIAEKYDIMHGKGLTIENFTERINSDPRLHSVKSRLLNQFQNEVEHSKASEEARNNNFKLLVSEVKQILNNLEK